MGKTRGRPTKKEQIEIKKILQKHYSRNYSPSFVIEITGFNPKTVYKFYDAADKQIQQNDDKNFIEKTRAERERINFVYDGQLNEYYQFLDYVNKEFEQLKSKNKETPRYLLNFKLSIMKEISNLHEKKGSFLLRPPLDESMRQIVKEIVHGEYDKHN